MLWCKTYITQIIASWKSSPQGKLTVVKMNGSDNDIIETWSEGIRFLWIPKEDEENEIHYEEYCKELASAFTTCMSEAEQNIIQINFFRHSMFLNNIKGMMPSCKFIIVIHYFDWGLDIGNDLSKMERFLIRIYQNAPLKKKVFYDSSQLMVPFSLCRPNNLFVGILQIYSSKSISFKQRDDTSIIQQITR